MTASPHRSTADKVSTSTASAADTSTKPAKTCPELLELGKVRRDELAPICERREAAGFAKEPANEVEKNLVGLALSGGGIRSASFNLGVLQAFYRSGLLRFVDYLSTVSGGGYIGSFLSSRVQALAPTEKLYEKDGAATPDEPPVGCKLGLCPDRDGTPSEPVKELMRSGQYLNRPLLFFNRYLIGLALNNIAFVSLLIALCAGLAYLWRSLDYIEVRWWINDALAVMAKWIPPWSPINKETVLALGGDVGVCFLPAAAFFACWIVCWCVVLVGRFVLLLTGIPFERFSAIPGADAFHRVLAKFIHKWMAATGWLTKILLFLSAACLLIGAAVLLGNSDIGQGTEGTFEHFSNPVVSVLGVLGLLGLLPILRPWRLIGSGHRPQSQVETYLFRLACTSILIGIPLCIVFLLARENVSGYATHSVDDILKWKDFAERIRDDRSHWPAKSIWEELGEKANGAPVYDVSAMEDVAQLNWTRAAVGDDPIITLQDFLYEEDMSPVFGNLRETKYSHVVKRRHLLLRAVNKVLSGPEDVVRDKELDFPFLYLAYQRDGFTAAANWVASPRLQPLAAASNFAWLSWKSKGMKGRPEAAPSGRPQLQAGPNQLSEDQRTRRQDLLEKYTSLLKNLATAKDFEDEFRTTEFRRELGQLLLAEHYPGLVPPVKRSVKRVIVIDKDQETRQNWFFIAGAIFLVSILFVNLNSTSLHGFYRDQLAETYLASGPNNQDVVLKDLAANTSKGAPYHVLAATLIQFPSLWKLLFNAQEPGALSKLVTWLRRKLMKPAKHAAAQSLEPKDSDLFVFSPLYCGSQVTGYQPTEEVRANMQNITLADAMAISGAAVTPLRVHNSLIRVLMVILNIRLGQWLPTPHRSCWTNWRSWVRWLGRWPSIPVLLANIAWTSDPRKRSLSFVTDGGHHENLGIWPLLQRRCRFVIVSDASQDNAHGFEDFLRLCRRSRLEAGISLVSFVDADEEGKPFPLHPLRILPDGMSAENSRLLSSLAARFSREHYIIAQINYPDAEPGYLVYLKSSLTGDEENDLVGFSQANAEFPHDPTSNAMFDEDQVESYRQLGFHIADKLCRDVGTSLEDLPLADAALQRTVRAATPARRLWLFESFAIRDIVNHWVKVVGKKVARPFPSKKDLLRRITRSLTRLHDELQTFQKDRGRTDTEQKLLLDSIAGSLAQFSQFVQRFDANRPEAERDQRQFVETIESSLNRINKLSQDFAAGKTVPVEGAPNVPADSLAKLTGPHFPSRSKGFASAASEGPRFVEIQMKQIIAAVNECEALTSQPGPTAPESVKSIQDAFQKLRQALGLGPTMSDLGAAAPQEQRD